MSCVPIRQHITDHSLGDTYFDDEQTAKHEAILRFKYV